MTRSRYRFFESEYPYFMTCTINSWLPIFTRQETATSFSTRGGISRRNAGSSCSRT
jgi:hypothetical protein